MLPDALSLRGLCVRRRFAVNDMTIVEGFLADARAHSLLNTGQAGLQPDCKLQLQSVLVRVTR